jgi:CheY-like chemotaxis protein
MELSQTEQRERKQLSKILHDHIQQLLVAAMMQVGSLKRGNDMEQMRATAQGVESILRETLDASRSLTIELSPPALDAAGLIGGLNWLVSRMKEKNQFTVNLRADHRAEPASEEMRYLLFECVRELLFNAMKHSGLMECDVAILQTRDRRIKIVIRDEGKGFDPDMLEKRLAAESTFGLFSVQQRLIHIGGEMEIVTSPGKGTSITITVPIGEVQPLTEDADSASEGAKRTDNVHMRGRTVVRRVLVVDDHRIMREGLVGLLQFEPDIEVVGQAADAQQAVELAGKLKPDVIIMDVSLGEMNGVEAVKRILAIMPNIKVIGLSMYANQNLANAMRDAGAIAYLTKGGPSEDLIATIRAACAEETRHYQ